MATESNGVPSDGVGTPTANQVEGYSSSHIRPIGDLQAESRAHFMRLTRSFEFLRQLNNPEGRMAYPDRPTSRLPRSEEDPHNTVVRFCDIAGAEHGRLLNMRIGVKDSISVAGVPVAGGHSDGPGPVPEEDAAVIERLLDAGATIAAKTVVSFGGLHDDEPTTDTRNPRNPDFSPGGSSSGSAAAIVDGIVDAALGTDGAGSVRIPAAWCGIVGLLPTRGLVPLHGCRDHFTNAIGPMTSTVADNATMLEAMVGEDWRDPYMAARSAHSVVGYAAAEHLSAQGLRLGIVVDALEPSGCTELTMRAFDDACNRLKGAGVTVRTVSVPLWTDAGPIFWALNTLGSVAEASSFGQGHRNLGRTDLSMMSAVVGQYGHDMLHAQRVFVEHMRQTNNGIHFAKAHNLALELRRQVDQVLDEVDLLITPTTPTGPFRLRSTRSADVSHAVSEPPFVDIATANTWICNLTGHPALTVPTGAGDNGLPTGLQFIGRQFDELTLYRGGFALEAAHRFDLANVVR